MKNILKKAAALTASFAMLASTTAPALAGFDFDDSFSLDDRMDFTYASLSLQDGGNELHDCQTNS